MSHSVRLVAVILPLLGAAGGCETATTIPPGAQQVHVVATVTEVHVNPVTVRAGEVYLVLDLPQPGVQLELMRGSASAGVSGPLSDADLARLAQNADAGGISSESLSVSCCGTVYRETLAAGKYAFLLRDPKVTQPGLQPVSIAVLEVTP
jgi:hypothetical protein